MTCPRCNHPLTLTENVLVYWCARCGQLYSPVAATVPPVPGK